MAFTLAFHWPLHWPLDWPLHYISLHFTGLLLNCYWPFTGLSLAVHWPDLPLAFHWIFTAFQVQDIDRRSARCHRGAQPPFCADCGTKDMTCRWIRQRLRHLFGAQPPVCVDCGAKEMACR